MGCLKVKIPYSKFGVRRSRTDERRAGAPPENDPQPVENSTGPEVRDRRVVVFGGIRAYSSVG